MLMERTLKTEILTHFTKKIAVKKKQRDPRVVSLCQSTWPHEVTATLEVQNATKRTRCVYNGYNKSQFHNDECKPSCAAHTVPYIDRHWGPAALQHEEQVVLMRKKRKTKCRKRCEATAGHGYNHRINAGLHCYWRPSADLWRSVETAPFTFSSPSSVPCSSLYAAGRMSTWSCQTWTRVHERAWGRKIGFLKAQLSRSGTLVWGSLQIGGKGRARLL